MLSEETKNCIVKLIDDKFEITEEIYHKKKQYSTCVEYNNDKIDENLTKKNKIKFSNKSLVVKKT